MNYNVLGYVVEQVSHQSYEAYIHQHILTPLHMQQTYFKTEKPTAVQKRSLSKDILKSMAILKRTALLISKEIRPLHDQQHH